MRFEIGLFLVTVVVLTHIYTDGKIWNLAARYKKVGVMSAVVFGAVFLWFLVRKNPQNAHQILRGSKEYLNYLPVDAQFRTSFLNPVLDFTNRSPYFRTDNAGLPESTPHWTIGALGGNGATTPVQDYSERRLMQSGKTGTKRSVSETKKKYVAAQQNWKCGKCGCQLPAWYEVDHITRLDQGGSNHIDNLVALCRECHGRKTALENL